MMVVFVLPIHLARHIVKPALVQVSSGRERGFDSDVAAWLVVGTAAVETEFRAIDQHVGPGDVTMGPAYGLWQIEPATADDIWHNFLRHRPELAASVQGTLADVPGRTMQLASNLTYGAVMARLVYRRSPLSLPATADPAAFALLWKQVYNTPQGKGTEAKFLDAWRRLVAPHFVERL